MWEFINKYILKSPYTNWIMWIIPTVVASAVWLYKRYKKYKNKREKERTKIFTGLIGGVNSDIKRYKK